MALFGMFNVHRHGAINSAAIVLYALTSCVSGYCSCRFYTQIQGQRWVWNIILTSSLFSGTSEARARCQKAPRGSLAVRRACSILTSDELIKIIRSSHPSFIVTCVWKNRGISCAVGGEDNRATGAITKQSIKSVI